MADDREVFMVANNSAGHPHGCIGDKGLMLGGWGLMFGCLGVKVR